MANKILKEGYHIEITSWENDGDNYKKNTVNVLTKEAADAVVFFCNLFLSHPRQGGELPCFGNADFDMRAEVLPTGGRKKFNGKLLQNWLQENKPEVLENLITYSHEILGWDDPNDAREAIEEYLLELQELLIGTWNYSDYTRVFEKVYVFHVPCDMEFLEVEYAGL